MNMAEAYTEWLAAAAEAQGKDGHRVADIDSDHGQFTVINHGHKLLIVVVQLKDGDDA